MLILFHFIICIKIVSATYWGMYSWRKYATSSRALIIFIIVMMMMTKMVMAMMLRCGWWWRSSSSLNISMVFNHSFIQLKMSFCFCGKSIRSLRNSSNNGDDGSRFSFSYGYGYGDDDDGVGWCWKSSFQSCWNFHLTSTKQSSNNLSTLQLIGTHMNVNRTDGVYSTIESQAMERQKKNKMNNFITVHKCTDLVTHTSIYLSYPWNILLPGIYPYIASNIHPSSCNSIDCFRWHFYDNPSSISSLRFCGHHHHEDDRMAWDGLE